MDDEYTNWEQKRLDDVMPWIGMYIAAASAVCVLAMAADVFNGFRCKKLWFPCKYFSLNTTSLTLLAAAMKLPVDLNTVMICTADRLAKLTSLIFMSTAMANFISSLGSMNDKAIVMNSIALALLVTTITTNVWIYSVQIGNLRFSDSVTVLTHTSMMLVLLALFVSSAITLRSSKWILESKYQHMYEVVLREEEQGRQQRGNGFRINELIGEMKKYLVMAETGSPQFVMARTVLSTVSSAICLFVAIISSMLYITFNILKNRSLLVDQPSRACGSIYKNSTRMIWIVQFLGVIVGTVAPAMRWFVSVSCKFRMFSPLNFKQVFKIEAHWIQALVYWRDNFSTSRIGHYHKCRKYLHDAKWFALTFCIGLQISIILSSKLLLFISTLLVTPMFLCFNGIQKLWVMICATNNGDIGHESSGDIEEVSLSRYVLLLEGEEMLPKWVVKSICYQADKLIQTSRKEQPQNLLLLLNKSNNFNGVREFDSIQVPNLHSHKEPPNCWTLPMVTLTSIAIALPNIEDHKSIQLMRGVEEGMFLAKLIDKSLDTNARLLNTRNAANVAWARVAVYRKWQGIDLKRASLKCKNSKDILQHLSMIAERTVLEFKQEMGDFSMHNHLNWPTKVIAANSMYRISQTILLSCQGKGTLIDEELFEHLFVTIADILAACLTNLASVIMRMCHHNAIEKREKSVCKAFLLLGRTEQILQILQQHNWPVHDGNKTTSIEEWRALLSRRVA